MAERLTECINSHLLDNGEMVKEYSLNSKIKLNHFSAMDIPNAVYDKLGQLEDILEKYGIESVEELDNALFQRIVSIDNPFVKGYVQAKIDAINRAEQDRDTWKRACELACKHISWCPAKQGECDCVKENRDCTNYFYQQAKEDGEQK